MAVRLFAAIRPPDVALDHLEAGLGDVRAGVAGRMRWVPRENWHLTLAFYGDVPEGALEDVQSRLAAGLAGERAIALDLRGAGSFGGRTLWVGVGGQVEAARVLMDGAAAAGGIEAGERRRAHLTVARTSRRSRDVELSGPVRALSAYRGPEWVADKVLLMRSLLGEGPGGGPLYEMVGRVPLG